MKVKSCLSIQVGLEERSPFVDRNPVDRPRKQSQPITVSELLVVEALLFGTRVAHSEIFSDHTYESSRPSSEQNRFLFVKIPNSGIRCDVVVLRKKEHHESINQSHQFIDKNIIPNRKILSVVPIPKRT